MKVKENYVKSFASEFKSYEFFYDFLKTNNSTANKLSIDYLSTVLCCMISPFQIHLANINQQIV